MEFDHVRHHVRPTILDDVKDGIHLISIHLDIHDFVLSSSTNCNFSLTARMLGSFFIISLM
jgi:hypothetical protein